MSSSPRLPNKPPATTTPDVSSSPFHLHSTQQSLLNPSPLAHHLPQSPPNTLPSHHGPPAPPAAPPPAIPKTAGSSARHPADGSDSEAETVVLPGAVEVHRKKEGSLQNGQPWSKRGTGGGEHVEVDIPRKKRRKQSDARAKATDLSTGEHRLRIAGDDDAAFSSDLSSAPSRASRPVSPSRQRLPAKRGHQHSRSHDVGRKRKAPDGSSDSDEDRVDSHHRARRRRSLAEPSPARRAVSRSSPPLSPVPPSPNRTTKSKAAQTGQKSSRHRKLPPPLMTSREGQSDDGHSSSSASSSRHGSPAVPALPRPQSAIRTPGSPVSMSHKAKRDTAGRTHLHKACQRGIVADVESILQNSRDFLNSEDNAGYMPIHEACLHGNLECVKLLVEYGAHVDIPSRYDSETPLLDAVDNGTQSPGHVAVIEYLLDKGADPRKKDKQGRTCFDANDEANAHEEETHRKIDELLKAAVNKQRAQRPSDDENTRASVPAPDRDSHSSRDPSVASPSHRSPPLTSVPTTHSRRRNARTEQSRKDLLWLDSGKGSVQKLREKSREGDLQMVHALLETGVAPDTETLIGAVKGGHTELVSLLLAYNAVVDPAPGQNGRESSRRSRDVSMPAGDESPMMAAIGRGNTTILTYLLANGANPRKLDSRGKSYAEIAREREGEDWEHEVEILNDAWNKAASTLKVSQHSSPHRRSPQKTKAAKSLRRNSTSSGTKSSAKAPNSRLNVEKGHQRSASANPTHRVEDNAAISDRESTAEPFAIPKSRVTKPRRSESDSVAPAIAKKKRRLISGKLLAEEEAALSRNETKSSEDSRFKKPKIEPDETDTKPANSADSLQQKVKPEQERGATHTRPERSSSDAVKKAQLVTHDEAQSPSRAPRTEPDKRTDLDKRTDNEALKRKRVEARTAEIPAMRDSTDVNGIKKSKDSSSADSRPATETLHPPTPKPKAESEQRPASREDILRKLRQQEDQHRREKEEAARKEAETHRRERAEEEAKQRSLEEEVREVLRQKHLRREQASIQRKAAEDRKVAQENDVITRELALRDQRVKREAMEREQEEKQRGAVGDVSGNKQLVGSAQGDAQENRNREAESHPIDAEKQERLRREAAEREAVESSRRDEETKQRLIKERQVAEFAAKERELREQVAIAKEAYEKRLKEEEAVEEARKIQQEREKQRQDELRRRQISEERRQKEEEEQRRLELEQQEQKRQQDLERMRKFAEEDRKRQEVEKDRETKKLAQELQAQLAAAERKRNEDEALERRRQEEREEKIRKEQIEWLDTLPFTLRKAMEKYAAGQPLEGYERYIPLFSATLSPPTPPASPSDLDQDIVMRKVNPSSPAAHWVLNIQVALIFGSDFKFTGYKRFPTQPVNDHQRKRMWSVLSPLLCEQRTPLSAKTITEVAASQKSERAKFLAMQPLFWVKFDDVLEIVKSESRLHHLKQLRTVEVNIDISPCRKPPTKEEVALRLSKRLGLLPSTSVSTNHLAKPNGSSSTMLPPPNGLASFGINHSSG